MSYNVTGLEPVKNELSISVADFDKWLRTESSLLPEANPIAAVVEEDYRIAEQTGERIKLVPFRWWGEGSGAAYCNGTLIEFAADLEGEGQFILIWEGGDHVDGLAFKDGKVYTGCVLRCIDPTTLKEIKPGS